ncbi:MAG: tetratricopeptide repeat protein [Spirochaetales bacterium]|nr:tetratricopeptide repeat protein [Spirochaetales bacterium]
MNPYKKAITLMEKKRWRHALQFIQKALDADEISDYTGCYTMAICLEELDEPDKAFDWFSKALNHRPQDADAMIGCGKCLFRMGIYEQSELSFLESLKLNPASSTACNDLGVLCFVQGRFSEAREWFVKALECDPSCSDALFNLADTCEELGEAEEAARYRRSLQEKGKNPKKLFFR